MIIIFILIASLLQLCTMSQKSPCSKYYKHIIKPGTNKIMGQIEIPSPTPKFPPYELKVGFNTNPLKQRKEPIAQLEIAQPILEAVQTVQQGKSLLYNIHFPIGQPIPTLTKIWFHNQQVCPNPNETESIRTTREIKQITYLPDEESIHGTNSGLSTIPPTYLLTTYLPLTANECGTNSYINSRNYLVAHGEETKPGQWPWLVALFVVMLDYKFTCAGSILTTKHIITAAHCLKLNSTNIHPNVLVVALGRFKLHQWRETGTVNREIESYRIHPDYTNTGDSDLAILTLRTPVEYSSFIRPICLWSGSNDLQNVINKGGYVVGWGQDQNGNYTAEPRLAKVLIKSQEDCLWSHQSFFYLTSNRTFCAGSQDNSVPCNGDSGSGLVLFDRISGRYQLRGIVSLSLKGFEMPCDSTNYVIYVDVAKYLPWIQQQISIT